MYFSGIGNDPLSASKVWLLVQRDGGIWSFPTWTKIIYRFTDIRKWVLRLWKKVNITLSLNWSYQGGCSQVLISSLSISLITFWDCWPCAWFLSRQTTGFSVLSWFWVMFLRTKTIRSHKSRAGIPSDLNPASKEMISVSFELCETEVCFLHIQLIGTNVWLPETHNVPPEVDFWVRKISRKIGVLNSPSLHCFAVLPTWQYCLYSHVWWIYEINRFRRLSQALVHFVIDRASLFTDHRISGLPILAKYKNFRTIWDDTFDNSPTDFNSSSLKWWSSMHGVDTLLSCWFVLFANSQHLSTHFLAWPSMS